MVTLGGRVPRPARHALVPDVLSSPPARPGDRVRLAADGLADAAPALSARGTADGRRTVVVAVFLLLAALVWVGVRAPTALAVGTVTAATGLYALTLGHRLVLTRLALRRDATLTVTDAQARAVPDDELPVYTVLVPAYREPEVIADVVASMAALEYPTTKLEVLLLLEEDDTETIAAARAACAGTVARVVLVPAAEPRTKPKACNYGLLLSSGEFVTIYDAEDQPEPLQLRRAVVAFHRAGRDVACLQARLSYHNAEQNVITRWFTVEYDTWFRWLLPGLVASGAPIPLGGTSNHIRRDMLLAVGGWDPYNVTEDADLGVRFARCGWRVAVLGSTTLEEANSDFVNWVKQRSRWYKGYLRTVGVHLRSPLALLRDLGPAGTAGFLLFVGGTPLLAMINPVFWALTALWWLGRPGWLAALFPAPVYYTGMVSWVVGGATLIYLAVANARLSGKPHLVLSSLTSPLYWAMMSLAAAKALVQLVAQPSYWEKTTHGLAKRDVESAAVPPAGSVPVAPAPTESVKALPPGGSMRAASPAGPPALPGASPVVSAVVASDLATSAAVGSAPVGVAPAAGPVQPWPSALSGRRR